MFIFSMFLTILANIFYHISQKNIPEALNPVSSLIITYATALLGSFLLYPLFPSNEGIILSFKHINWSSFILGIALIGLELGFLLAYRSGWNISVAAIFSNSFVTILLVPIGIALFKENISVKNIIGVVICVAGLYLIQK